MTLEHYKLAISGYIVTPGESVSGKEFACLCEKFGAHELIGHSYAIQVEKYSCFLEELEALATRVNQEWSFLVVNVDANAETNRVEILTTPKSGTSIVIEKEEPGHP